MRWDILKVLRQSGDYVSGQVLSRELGISRVSVWKHIRNLKEDGYVIEASPRGYRLTSCPDLLLPGEFPGWEQKIHHFGEAGSTMTIAKELVKRGAGRGGNYNCGVPNPRQRKVRPGMALSKRWNLCHPYFKT